MLKVKDSLSIKFLVLQWSRTLIHFDAILGGLIGSIITVVIGKVLDLIQQSKQHKYSIQKTFFTKKLEVADAAVSQWYLSANLLGSIARLYEQAPVLEKVSKEMYLMPLIIL